MKRILMPICDGFEEIEALTVVDILRRAGLEIIIAGTVDGLITGRNKIKIEPDELLDEVINESFDMIYIPGGPGTNTLAKDQRILSKIREMHSEDKLIAAICAAPKVLHVAGILGGKIVTSFPAVKNDLKDIRAYSEDRVVIDGNLITSRGAGTSLEFALKLVEILLNKEKSTGIANDILAIPV